MMTVDYAFYTDTYHGALTEDGFSRASVFASAYLDELTMGRITDRLGEKDRLAVKLALCAVCDARAVDEQRDGIAAESNDGISVSYDKSTGRMYNAAALYLASTGLLYRGVES